MDKQGMIYTLYQECYKHDACDNCPLDSFENCDFSFLSEDTLKRYIKKLEEKKMKETNKTNRYIYVNLTLKSGTKNYLFSVPEGAEVTYGDILIVKTHNSHELEGIAVSNPVTLDSTFLAVMKQELSINGDIQPVVGKRTIQRF